MTLIALALASQASPAITALKGGRLLTGEERVVVGRSDGSVTGLNSRFREDWRIPSPAGRIRHLAYVDGSAWWADEAGQTLFHVPEGLTAVPLPVSKLGLQGKVVSLSDWKNRVLVQTEDGYRLVERKSGKVIEDDFPGDVRAAAQKGQILAAWDRKIGGLFFVLSRAGNYNTAPEPGGTTDITRVQAWRVTPQNGFVSLGSYHCESGPFRETAFPGRSVTDLGRFLVRAQGLVVLMKRSAILVPMADRNFSRVELPVAIDPEYTNVASIVGSRVVYSAPKGIGEIDLESKEPAIQSRVRDGGVAALFMGENGLLIGRQNQVLRSPTGVIPGYVRVDLSSETTAESQEAQKLRAALSKPENSGLLTAGGETAVTQILGATFGKSGGAMRRRTAREVNDLSYGDLLVDASGTRSLYVGGGRQLTLLKGGPQTRPVSIGQGFRALRIARDDGPVVRYDLETGLPLPQTGSTPVMGQLTSRQGHGIRLNIGGPYDRPYVPAHQTLMAEAVKWLGTPYVYGGNGEGGIDCSAFVGRCFRATGVSLPRVSYMIAASSRGRIVTDELRFGDVIYIRTPSRHVAIYVGNGRTIEATPAYVKYREDMSIYFCNPVIVRRFLD